MFGDGDGIAAGSVHDEHTGGGGGVKIDVIDADASAADDAELGRLRENVRVDFDGAAHEQSVAITEMGGVAFWIRDDDVPAGLCAQ